MERLPVQSNLEYVGQSSPQHAVLNVNVFYFTRRISGSGPHNFTTIFRKNKAVIHWADKTVNYFVAPISVPVDTVAVDILRIYRNNLNIILKVILKWLEKKACQL